MDHQTVDELLTTTRSVRRRLDFDRPVPLEQIRECLEIAIQAPSGSNRQDWRWLVVTDASKKAAIAECYRAGMAEYTPTRAVFTDPSDPRTPRSSNVMDAAQRFLDRLHEIPVMVIPCIDRRAEHDGQAAQASLYGSILPAAWSFMLAARARGLGTCWTTLHLRREAEARSALGLPEHVTQVAMFPVAYFTGETFRPAPRIPLHEITYYDTWGVRQV